MGRCERERERESRFLGQGAASAHPPRHVRTSINRRWSSASRTCASTTSHKSARISRRACGGVASVVIGKAGGMYTYREPKGREEEGML